MIDDIIERPVVAIDNVIWTYQEETKKIQILLVKKSEAPFKNYWGLPETFLRVTEDADEAALRLIRDKIGIQLTKFHTEQLKTFTNRNRFVNNAVRHLSLAYMTFLPGAPKLVPGYGAKDARWFDVSFANDDNYNLIYGQYRFETVSEYTNDEQFYEQNKHDLPENQRLAFDHRLILKEAFIRVRNKLDYAPSILHILGHHFTLRTAREVYAVFLRVSYQEIDNSNFRKTHAHIFEEVGIEPTGMKGRPAKLYRLKR